MFTWHLTTNAQTLCWSKTNPLFSGAHSSCISQSINTNVCTTNRHVHQDQCVENGFHLSQDLVRMFHILSEGTFFHPVQITSVRDGQPSRTTASVYGSGLLRSTASYHGWLRRTTPDYAGLLPDYFELRRTTSGLLRSTRPDTGGSQYPPRGPAWASGKLPTRLPVSPVPVQFTSTVSGLGRDSLIYNQGWGNRNQ